MISDNSLNLLEFNRLLNVISAFSNSEASKKSILNIRPLDKKEDIEKRFAQIHEIRKIFHEGRPLGLYRFPDISNLILKVRPEGAILEPTELSNFIPVLSIASDISFQMREIKDIPFLKELTAGLTGFPDILNLLRRSIDNEGNILDSASFTLAELRGEIRRLEGRIMKKLEEMIRDKRLSVFLQDDFITKRSGRWVIPVRMDSKGQVQGVVHDVSKSGETAFIEPLKIIHLANELENLIAEEKAEEIRILRNISSKIRDIADDFETQYKIIVYLDVLNSIVKFADQLLMEIPQINDSDMINLVKGRHPLLMLTFQKMVNTLQVVPLDINLGGDNTVMVITGPNAGGKTIAIKTIGLLLAMALSGIPLPADSSSSFPLVRDLLIDIGDKQSIENNLSTFSAHISNISAILRRADSKTLVLIDELGTGTDPEEGTALACAILKEMKKSRALVFATTHLIGIKGFVHRTEGMLNASMEFDQKMLTPLFRLRIGEPGQSHALEIARRYGLPDYIVDIAKGMLGRMKVEFDNLIADLNEKRAQYEMALAEMKRQQSEIDGKNERLERMLSEAEDRKKDIFARAYKEASDIILDTKRQMHSLLEEMKKKERSEGRKILRQVEAKQELVAQRLREYDVDKGTPSMQEIRPGEILFIKSLGYDAEVTAINPGRHRLTVRAGSKEIEVPLSDASFKRGRSLNSVKETISIDTLGESVSSRISLGGLRVDEALSKLESFLNHASLSGLSEVTIIHGIGKGLLSKAVREHLKAHPLVKEFRSGDPSEGGSGVTFVILA
ncbi:MAG: endonuclease MutS2 [Nitrospirota bacterium]